MWKLEFAGWICEVWERYYNDEAYSYTASFLNQTGTTDLGNQPMECIGFDFRVR
jgi:hypothetical protein